MSADEIRAALRKGAVEMKFTPVLCATAFKNKGVQHLLDAIVDYLSRIVEATVTHPRRSQESELFVNSF